jgi:hypothetical protein
MTDFAPKNYWKNFKNHYNTNPQKATTLIHKIMVYKPEPNPDELFCSREDIASTTEGTTTSASTIRIEEMSDNERFRLLTAELNVTHDEKNGDYGNSFDKSIERYGLVSALTRLSDKFNRAEHLILESVTPRTTESLRDTLMDMAAYALMTAAYLDRENHREWQARNNLGGIEQDTTDPVLEIHC